MTFKEYIKKAWLPYVLAGGLVIGIAPLIYETIRSGCKEVKTETSDVLHEDATIVTRIHSPSTHKTELSPRLVKVGSGFGISEHGVGPSFGGIVITCSTVHEKYGAVFKCQHGTFTSQGSDERHKNLYDKLQDGQEVDVTYKEIYRTTYKDTDGDGKKDLIERVLIGFDFLDANPKK